MDKLKLKLINSRIFRQNVKYKVQYENLIMRHVLVCLYSAVLGLSEAQLGMMIELETESEENLETQ